MKVYLPCSSVEVAELAYSLLPDLFAFSMAYGTEQGNVAFDAWFSLRDTLRLMEDRGSVILSTDERAEFLRSLGMAHLVEHIGADPLPSVVDCHCSVASTLRRLAVLLGEADVSAVLAARAVA